MYAAATLVTEENPWWATRGLFLFFSSIHVRQWKVLSEYDDVLHGCYGHRPFSRVLCAVAFQSVASLLVGDDSVGLGE